MNYKMTDQVNKIKVSELNKNHAEESMATVLWETAKSGFKEDPPWTVKQFLKTLIAGRATVLTASIRDNDRDKIVGFMIARTTTVESDIYMIVVGKDYKQQGVGRKLFCSFIKLCTEKGLETIFLEVRESNNSALKLYQSLDFKEIGRRKAYYSKPTEDGLMMKLDL